MINRISNTYQTITINKSETPPQKHSPSLQNDVFVKNANNVAFKGIHREVFNFKAFYDSMKKAQTHKSEGLLPEASKIYKRCFFEIERHIFHNCEEIMEQDLRFSRPLIAEPHLFKGLKTVTEDLCTTLCERGQADKAKNYFHDATKLTKEFNLGATKHQVQEMNELEKVLFKDYNPNEKLNQTSDNISSFFMVSPDDETRELSTEMISQLIKENAENQTTILSQPLQDIDTSFLLEPHQIKQIQQKETKQIIEQASAKAPISLKEKEQKLELLRDIKKSKEELQNKEEMIVQLIKLGYKDINNEEYLQRLRSDYIGQSITIAKNISQTLSKEKGLAELKRAKEFLSSNNLL